MITNGGKGIAVGPATRAAIIDHIKEREET